MKRIGSSVILILPKEQVHQPGFHQCFSLRFSRKQQDAAWQTQQQGVQHSPGEHARYSSARLVTEGLERRMQCSSVLRVKWNLVGALQAWFTWRRRALFRLWISGYRRAHTRRSHKPLQNTKPWLMPGVHICIVTECCNENNNSFHTLYSLRSAYDLAENSAYSLRWNWAGTSFLLRLDAIWNSATVSTILSPAWSSTN